MSYAKTYRVQGIPAQYSADLWADQLLRSALGDNTGLIIHSLGLDPSPSGDDQFKVATVSFRNEPALFQDGKDEWTLPVFIQSISGGNHSITVDSHFLGFTPLNDFEYDSAHKIE